MHGKSRWSLWPLLFSVHDAPKKCDSTRRARPKQQPEADLDAVLN